MSGLQDSAVHGAHRQAETAPQGTAAWKAPLLNLWANLDGRAVRRDPPEFFDFFVGKRDATRRPIPPAMKRAHPAESILNSVYHYIKTGRDTALGGVCVVISRWIGNVQRKMKIASRIPVVDVVDSFRRFHVALLLLWADRIVAQRNPVSLEPLAFAKDRQIPRRFLDDNPIDRRPGRQRTPIAVRVEVEAKSQGTDGDKGRSDFANHAGDL